jgi:hypothetical protein
MGNVRLSLEQKADIWDAYQRKTPQPGQAFTDWATKCARHYGCGVGAIRAVITRQRADMDIHIEHQSHTHAQQLASSMGLSMVDVFKTIKRNLTATRKDLIYVEKIVQADEPEESVIEEDYEGKRGQDPTWEKGTRKQVGKRTRALRIREAATDGNGKFIYFEQPDNKAQLMAAEQLGRILNVNAPEEMALNVNHHHTIDLSDEELKKELADAAEQLAKLQAIEIEAERIPEALGGGSRKTRRKKLPLLDAQLYENGGRAGRDGESHQTVPGQAVFQASASGARQRDDTLHREEPHHDAVVDRSGLGDAQDGHQTGDGSAGSV